MADALRLAVDTEDVRLVITTGDNIYAGRKLLGIPIGATGDEDDDWFFTYFQPYRYILNRVPVYPSIGNHDAAESEDCDDRAQVEDNFYICERIVGRGGGRPRVARTGAVLPVPLRLGHRVSSASTRRRKAFFKGHRLFEFPKHWTFVDGVAARDASRHDVAHSVRAPSAVQRRAAAPQHEGDGAASCRCSIAPAWR